MDINIKHQQKYTLVGLAGRIDSYTAPGITKSLKDLISKGHCNLVLDFTNVSFISSSGILALVNAQKKCKLEDRGNIVISSIPDLVYSGFALAGFDKLFDFYDDAGTAAGSF